MALTTEQILLHLYDCIDYGFSYRAKKGLFILDEFPVGWRDSYSKQLGEGIKKLNKLGYISKKENHYDGSVIVSLSEKGKLRALNLRFRRLHNKKEKWDEKWRMVAFDIPEDCKRGRNALRYRLATAGFYELQESLFLYPYDCEKEIKAFIKLFKLEKYVRFALLEYIDNEEDVKKSLRFKSGLDVG
jgi:DNA-binding transcriptional regulator PaaX